MTKPKAQSASNNVPDRQEPIALGGQHVFVPNPEAPAPTEVGELIEPDTYRGWTISYDPPPIPVRSFDWSATHPDYDASWEGEEDGWVGNGLHVRAATRDALLAEIDDAQDEWNETNDQFGVGA